VAGARHRGTPAREAAEHEGMEHEAAEQGAREAAAREGGDAAPSREGGRPEAPPCRAEQGGRTVGLPEGLEGKVGWWSRPAAQHCGMGGRRRTGGVGRVADAGGWQAVVGAGKAPRRPSGGRR
jgi:hypothetical protein